VSIGPEFVSAGGDLDDRSSVVLPTDAFQLGADLAPRVGRNALQGGQRAVDVLLSRSHTSTILRR
jgi:hypothetical protein